MMEAGVYIAKIKMTAKPKRKMSRLSFLTIHYDKYPIILDENGVVQRKEVLCRRLMGDRAEHYDKYDVNFEYYEPQFSTKIYGR